MLGIYFGEFYNSFDTKSGKMDPQCNPANLTLDENNCRTKKRKKIKNLNSKQSIVQAFNIFSTITLSTE